MQIQNTHVNTLVTAACAVAAVWLGAQLTWQLASPTTDVPSGPLKVTAETRSTQVSARSIIALDLFGAAARSAQVAASNAPKTSLNIRLLGVSASNVPARSAAIIERSGQQEVYVVGEKLAGTEVEITEIYADRVILDNNGRIETLELEGIGELSEGLSLTMANVTASSRAVVESPSEPVRDSSEFSEALKAGNILDFIQITPVREGAGLKGYRLAAGPNPELFLQAGFRDGDLAVAINGQDLTDISAAMKLTQELATMTEATVTVVRDEQYFDLRLDISDLPQAQNN